MYIPFRGFIVFIALGMLSSAYAADVSKKEIKSLDEQVQELKTEALDLGEQMRLLEEKLLYPSGTQVAVFVSVEKAAKYSLDSMEIRLDGKTVIEHVYTVRELQALQKGGVQRIYTGNIRSGQHDLHVLVTGKNSGGVDFYRDKKFKFGKDEGPKMVEIRLVNSADQIITLVDW